METQPLICITDRLGIWAFQKVMHLRLLGLFFHQSIILSPIYGANCNLVLFCTLNSQICSLKIFFSAVKYMQANLADDTCVCQIKQRLRFCVKCDLLLEVLLYLVRVYMGESMLKYSDPILKFSTGMKIRAVPEQRSSPELHLSNKTKMHLKQRKTKLTQNHKSMRMFYILTSSPTPWHVPWRQQLWNGSRPSKVLIFERWMLSDDWLMWYRHFINHEKF